MGGLVSGGETTMKIVLLLCALLIAPVVCDPVVVTGNSFVIANGANTPQYQDRTLFDRVVSTETNAFRILNTNAEGGDSVNIVSIDVTGSGFVLEEEADSVIAASFDSLFSVTFTATIGGTFDGTVSIQYTSGGDLFAYTFAIRATVAEVNLVLSDDEYTTDWSSLLVVNASRGLLSNDLSLQGVLRVSSVSSIQGPAAFAFFDLATGAFSLNITQALYNGPVTFNYTATNGFDTVTAGVLVNVVDADSAIQCQEDVVLEAPTGTSTSAVFYTTPTASFGAPVSQVSGPVSGAILSYFDSPYEVVYEAAGLDGISGSVCSFTIEITIQPPSISCPADQFYTVRNDCGVDVDLPDGVSTGFEVQQSGAIITEDNAEPISLDSQRLPLGTHLIEYTLTDSTGQSDQCDFEVTVELVPESSPFKQLAGYIDGDLDGHGQIVDEFGFPAQCVLGTRDASNSDPTRVLLGSRDFLSALSDDCNDNDPKVYPGHNEICDGIDNNCNGRVDEGRVCSPTADRPILAQPVHIPSLVSFAPVREVVTVPTVPDVEEPVVITISPASRLLASAVCVCVAAFMLM